MATIDTSCHSRRRQERMADPEFRREYELARAQIEQVDAVMQRLDDLREELGLSKAQLARRIGKNPAALRRLFTSDANPELKTVAALASALDAEVQIVPRRRRKSSAKRDLTGVALGEPIDRLPLGHRLLRPS